MRRGGPTARAASTRVAAWVPEEDEQEPETELCHSSRVQIQICEALCAEACRPWGAAQQGWARLTALLVGVWSTYHMGVEWAHDGLSDGLLIQLRTQSRRTVW